MSDLSEVLIPDYHIVIDSDTVSTITQYLSDDGSYISADDWFQVPSEFEDSVDETIPVPVRTVVFIDLTLEDE